MPLTSASLVVQVSQGVTIRSAVAAAARLLELFGFIYPRTGLISLSVEQQDMTAVMEQWREGILAHQTRGRD